ncbi:PREDICTED: uncharacterized protein LOC106744360 [Dinoponera quadriceps]|uniref:Uncharacterized protein LOC106744360 n=1 Tax=Dinoponera quadriceps TaxID=609295 RepID=A0A6P3X800_DINQU|nr:PREDICTED: uncharacterized protein LOC106744360 [Dinoponera quadriceps]
MYKHLLAQRVTRYNGEWYCYLCDYLLLNKEEAKYHLPETHFEQINTTNQILKFLDTNKISNSQCNKLIFSGIILKNLPQDYFCTICQCSIPTFNHIHAHVMGKYHQVNKTANTTEKNSRDQKNSDSYASEISVQTDTSDILEYNSIKVSDGPHEYFCEICKCSIPTYNHVRDHVNGRNHQAQKTANTAERNLTTTQQNSNGRRNSLDETMENLVKQINDVCNLYETIQTDTSSDILKYNGIKVSDGPHEYFCEICKCSIPTYNHVRDHVNGRNHQAQKTANTAKRNLTTAQQNSNGRRNSLDETIENLVKRVSDVCNMYRTVQTNTSLDIPKYDGIKVSDGPHEYFCEICKCSIPTYNHVRDHVNGRNHQAQKTANTAERNLTTTQQNSNGRRNSLDETMENLVKQINDVCNLYETIQTDTSSDILKYNGIKVSDGPHEYFCEICKCSIPTYNHVRDHVNGRNHQAQKTANTAKRNLTTAQQNSNRRRNSLDETIENLVKRVNDVCNLYRTIQTNTSLDISKYNGIKVSDGPHEYFCEICKCSIPTYNHVCDHVNGKNHQAQKIANTAERNLTTAQQNSNGRRNVLDETIENLVKRVNDVCSLHSTVQTNTSLDIPKYDGIKVSDGPHEYCCEICNCVLPTYNHVRDHVNGRKHQTYKKTCNVEENSRDIQRHSDDYLDTDSGTSLHEEMFGTNINVCMKKCSEQTPTSTTGRFDMLPAADTSRLDMLPLIDETSIFITPDIREEMSTLVWMRLPEEKRNNKSASERYNRIYKMENFLLEEIMFSCCEMKLKKIQENLQFYIPFTNQSVTCLACDASYNSCDIQIWYEHVSCTNHAEQVKQLDPKLLQQLIKKQSTHVKCYSCNEIMDENAANIHVHINKPFHQTNRNRLLKQIMSHYNDLLKQTTDHPLFYAIQYFACVPCKKRFKMKIEFTDHLYETHRFLMRTKNNRGFGFCLTCAILWYDNDKCLYSAHCRNPIHKYLVNSNDFAIKPLPEEVTTLLESIDETVDDVFKESNDKYFRYHIQRIMEDLTYTFTAECLFVKLNVKLHVYGSKYTGLALEDSDVDIYVDFGKPINPESIESMSREIESNLRCFFHLWRIEEVLHHTRTPIIRVKHKPTGEMCDISYTHGLSVENSKLIKSFNDTYLPCRKMILFLKKWMKLCYFTRGTQKISNYALTWLVIFYLQVKHGFPSIISLIKNHNNSKIVAGWQVGVGDTFAINVPELPIHELLLGFFEYYGEFNYTRFVICPLLGKECDKKLFSIPLDKKPTFPEGMEPYMTHLKGDNPEFFRIDSSMCVQDPFVLSFNITRAVQILMLRDFKHYCKESALKLRKISPC